jgi:ABC-type dipeptide/oligopeptide/nickel transport system permease component
VSIAIGATIPVEALCGIPGLGKLAWQSALGRDLPLLMTITVLVTVATMIANSAADIASEALHLPKG